MMRAVDLKSALARLLAGAMLVLSFVAAGQAVAQDMSKARVTAAPAGKPTLQADAAPVGGAIVVPVQDGTASADAHVAGPTWGSDVAERILNMSPAAARALSESVLTVDQEALYAQSAWGKRAQAELSSRAEKVAADNDRIAEELASAEDDLTRARATLSAEEFRRRAKAFDERATRIRNERRSAAVAVTQADDASRAKFFTAIAPIMGELMSERGALVVLDQRTVLFSDRRVDVTTALIERIDDQLGDGPGLADAPASNDDGPATRPDAAAPVAITQDGKSANAPPAPAPDQPPSDGN